MRYLVAVLLASGLCACAGGRLTGATAPEVSWHCEFDPEQSWGGRIFVVVDGQSVVLFRQAASGCCMLARSEYRAHDVPDHAISAAAGWFAGYGEEFYARLQRQTVLVYHRLVEETGPEHPRYRLIAQIPWHPTTPNQAMQRTAR